LLAKILKNYLCARTHFLHLLKIYNTRLTMSKNHLNISGLSGVNQNSSIGVISDRLDQLQPNTIGIELWPDYHKYYDVPKVSFKIAHARDYIFLKYDVEEHEVLARYRKTNEPVYKDSCVEFFIAFDGPDKPYYNLEFNRLGTCLGGYGKMGQQRDFLPAELLETIKYERAIHQKRVANEPVINWTLTLMIPLQVFCHHQISTLKGKKCGVNFYKCGDDLTQPHYLAWNSIEAPAPNFHRPDFFGTAEFL
jgi:hypothetical protein